MSFVSKLIYILKSLRFRIGILIFAVIVLPTTISLYTFVRGYEDRSLSSLSATITSQAQLISSQIVMGGYLSDNSRYSINSRLNALREMFAGRIMIMDSNMKILIDTYDIYEGRILIWEGALRAAAGETVLNYDQDNSLITVAIPIGTSDDIAAEKVYGVVMVSRNADQMQNDIAYYKNSVYSILAGVILLALIAAIAIPYVIMLPIDNLSKGVKELNDGGRTKLETSSVSEISAISEQINLFSDKQRSMDTSMKDFLSNVSHELKTPITSMKILADSLMSSEDTPVEFYREFMVDIASEIDRETAIINDLMGLVRSENYTTTLKLETVNINEIMERVMHTLRPIAEKAGVELVLETFKPVMIDLDTVKFSQAMINIIENAIKYNVLNGYVHVSVNSDANDCFIRVEDSGIGIPKESLEQIFERFYRVDTSHSKEIEGSGIGLSIVKNIITLHNGQIKADSVVGQGTVFSIRLPLINA